MLRFGETSPGSALFADVNGRGVPVADTVKNDFSDASSSIVTLITARVAPRRRCRRPPLDGDDGVETDQTLEGRSSCRAEGPGSSAWTAAGPVVDSRRSEHRAELPPAI